MRTQVPVAIAFIAGVVMVIQFFVPTHHSMALRDTLLAWTRIISAFALVVGIGSLVSINISKLRRLSPGWIYAIVTLAGFAVMAVFGILGTKEAAAPAWRHTLDRCYQWLFDNVQVPMDATIFSLLAFFIASAAYRTFRARTFEASLLLAAALLVMVGRVPLGVEIGAKLHEAIWGGSTTAPVTPEWLQSLTEWVLNCPNTAAQRAIMFGAALAAVAQALRIIVGIERPYMSGS
ncbi:MAG TPA: hypothetical protein PLD23_20765 [Armatimonadota bacterium]|nr:hypothetical protein [Armatimonadota bacterium]